MHVISTSINPANALIVALLALSVALAASSRTVATIRRRRERTI